jgi:hypothetical protein
MASPNRQSLVVVTSICYQISGSPCLIHGELGVFDSLAPSDYLTLFSDEGRSFSFDSRGTGYGRGEGCRVVILKPLDQALRDNDNVRSVIVSSGINQDGKTAGITMPNGCAQGK